MVSEDRTKLLQEWMSSARVPGAELSLVNQALLHRSFVNELGHGKDNERLEFLGDAVLGTVMCEYLFEHYPESPEGQLTKLKSQLVSRPTMARLARELGLGRVICLGKGEEVTGGRERGSVLGNALEALIGAVYLSAGLEAARDFVMSVWQSELTSASAGCANDAKSALQELTQAQLRKRPTYRIISEEGPDHAKLFVSQVSCDGMVLGEGRGATKKEAEQQAAREAVQELGGQKVRNEF